MDLPGPLQAHDSQDHHRPAYSLRRQNTLELEAVGTRLRQTATAGDIDNVNRSPLRASREMVHERTNWHAQVLKELRYALLRSWLHVLFILVPVGFVLRYTRANEIANFLINLVAMVPSTMVLAHTADDLMLRIGGSLGALISTTFNNVATLITSVLLLRSRNTVLVQLSIAGAVLTNLAFIPGCCFIVGGLRYASQDFNGPAARTLANLVLLALFIILVTTAFQIFSDVDSGVTPSSRGSAVIMIFTYGFLLVFQTHTHTELFKDEGSATQAESFRPIARKGAAHQALVNIGSESVAPSSIVSSNALLQHAKDLSAKKPKLSISTSLALLLVFTTVLTFNSLFATDAVQFLLSAVSREFVGLILIPVLSSDPTVLQIAMRNRINIVMALTLGKCLQVVLLVMPLLVCLSWFGVGAPAVLDLNFDGYSVTLMFGSAVVVNYLLQEESSNWLMGVLLLAAYAVMAIQAWFYPSKGDIAG